MFGWTTSNHKREHADENEDENEDDENHDRGHDCKLAFLNTRTAYDSDFRGGSKEGECCQYAAGPYTFFLNKDTVYKDVRLKNSQYLRTM